MRRIGGHVSTAGGLEKALKRTSEIGANCLQIFAGSPRSWARKLYSIEESISYVLAAKRMDIEPIFIHALYLVNLATDNQDLLKKSTDSLVSDLKNGDLINSAGVIVHIGSHQGRGFESVKVQIVDQINKILNATKNTRLLIENSAGQKGKVGTFEEIVEIFSKIKSDRLGICLDSAHLFESGKNISDIERFELIDKIGCLHLNDSKTDFNSRNDQHANLGDGKIGLKSLSEFINLPSISKLPVILEVPGELGTPDAKNIQIAKDLSSPPFPLTKGEPKGV